MSSAWGPFLLGIDVAPRALGDATSPCDVPPDGLSADQLKEWSVRCGEAGAATWIADNTGINPVIDGNGNVDWVKTSEITLATEAGVPVVTNADGSPNWPASAAGAAGVPVVMNTDGSPNWAKTASAVAKKNGIPIVLHDDGSPDWKGTAEATITLETGGVSIDVGIVNDDGSMNYDVIAYDAGSIGAAAVCTGLGAGIVAPVCSWVGGQIGVALYEGAKEIYEYLFVSPSPPPPTPLPGFGDDIN